MTQHMITAACGCYTDKRNKLQHKCCDHASNRVADGYTRV